MTNFDTTRWTHIQAAGAGGLQSLELFCECYGSAMVAHLVYRRSIAQETAEDHVQSFFLHVLANPLWFTKADKTRGKFRTFLLTSLDNFVRGRHRKDHRQATRSLDVCEEVGASCVADEVEESHDVFERSWALDLIARALARWKLECDTKDQRIWEVFEQRVLRPAIDCRPPPSYNGLFQQIGFDSPKQAMNGVTTASRAIRRHLTTIIREAHLNRQRRLQELKGGDLGNSFSDDVSRLVDEAVQDDLRDLRRVFDDSRTKGPLPDRSAAGGDEAEVTLEQFLASHLNDSPVQPAEPTSPSSTVGRVLPHPDNYDLVSLASALFGTSEPQPLLDLAQLLQHQLTTPVQFELAGRPDSTALTELTAAEGLMIRSLADLLEHPRPPVELLVMVKDFALAQRNAANPSIVPEIASVLFFAAVAAAIVKLAQNISDMPSEQLCKGLRWARSNEWCSTNLVDLFTQAIGRLEQDDWTQR